MLMRHQDLFAGAFPWPLDGVWRAAFLICSAFGVLAVGLLLTLGPGQLILDAIPHPGAHTKHLLELAAGLVALALVPVLWRVRHRVAHSVAGDAKRGNGSTFALGAGIALAETPTAFPYFVVIAAIVGSESNLPTQAALVLLFNAVLILPLLVIVAICIRPGADGRRALNWLRVKLDRWAPLLVPGVVLLIGVALVGVGAVGLLTD